MFKQRKHQANKEKISYIFYGALKGFMMALKALINPFEAPQRSLKIKI